ncbi:MAG TPA: glycosyl hydrolase [Verrucomicrobiae bacterium]
MLLFLAVCQAIAGAKARAATSSGFGAQFANPPAESRIIKIIHSWPDDDARQDALIRTLSGQGFGGVVCNVSFTEYLQSEAKWKAFTRAVAEAKKAGFALWLYDEKGYPSATAGGLVLRDHPEWEARGLLIATAEAENALATLEIPPGTPRLIAALPFQGGKLAIQQVTNLSRCVVSGRLSWQAPPGRWLVIAIIEDRLYEGTHASMSLSEHMPYPNLLDPEPTARFLELTHGAYSAHLGNDLGKDFVSTFTDEPSLMSLFLRPMPYRVLPWSANLATEFRGRHGYSIEAKLPALVADIGPETGRIRYDYWKMVGELVAENYFGQIQRWCKQHDILSGGHLLMEENLANQIALYGDFFACLRRLDAPSIDCLTSLPEQVPWYIARLAGSAADLEQKTVTMCETSDHSQRYRPAGDRRAPQTVTPAQIRGTCNRLMVSGIDTVTSYYSFDGLTDGQLRELNEYIGRCCFALKGGHQVADIAVLYPIESVWPRFTPSRHYANECPAAAEVENVFRDVSDTLFAAGRDFTYVDGRALAEAKVRDGALVHGDLRWRVVILPDADTLPIRAWENLARFVSTGGVLISIGALPTNSETEFPSARVQTLAATIFGSVASGPSREKSDGASTKLLPRISANAAGGAGFALPPELTSLLPVLLDSMLERDCGFSGDSPSLKYTHRRIEKRDVYFVINDSNKRWKGMVSLCADGSCEQWDAVTGQAASVADAQRVVLDLAPYGSAIFRAERARVPKRHKPGKEMLPAFTLRKLPRVSPTVGRGEFVREQTSELDASAGARTEQPTPAQPVHASWRVCGAITKGQVDTFLFLNFACSENPRLETAHTLVLDTWVPEGQKSPTQLLAILHETSGADYIASTGRLLNAPGHQQSWIPWTRFQLAGWSKDPNGRLDLEEVRDLRIGWGGYLGAEGENVEFSLAQPRVATLSFDRTGNTSPSKDRPLLGK